MDISETTRWLVQLVLAGGAVVIAAFIYMDVAPRLQPSISFRVIDRSERLVVLRLTVANPSRAFIKHDKVRGSLFQVIPYAASQHVALAEFVPFSEESSRGLPATAGDWAWTEPVRILEGTAYWYPGDVIAVERMVHLPDPDTLLHVGVQVHGSVSWWVRAMLRCHGVRRRGAGHERWTTTAFVGLEPVAEVSPGEEHVD